ncbi:MAG: hypothetical protein R2709_00590 [Marmoricola sp.]
MRNTLNDNNIDKISAATAGMNKIPSVQIERKPNASHQGIAGQEQAQAGAE